MSKDVSAAEQVTDVLENEISEEQVVDYLRNHLNFFNGKDELLANLSLPHEI